jgi:acyl-CoA reductase-like NAD-dependent aldehyde dehydrogenase
MTAVTEARGRFTGLFIDSRWVEPCDGAREEVVNPATEEVVDWAPVGSAAKAGSKGSKTFMTPLPYRPLTAAEAS